MRDKRTPKDVCREANQVGAKNILVAMVTKTIATYRVAN